MTGGTLPRVLAVPALVGLALLVLPLYIPTLIFGISAMEASVLGTGGAAPSLLILAAISLASAVLGPLAAAAALRMQLG